ncbi:MULTISPECIES: hypothetical protein [Bacteria]
MSKRPKNSRPSSRQGPPRGAAFGVGAARRTQAEPELHREVDRLLLSASALDLLAYASTLVASIEPAGPLKPPRTGVPSLTELIAMFRDTGARATDALLLVLTALDGDEMLARRISGEVTARRHPLPTWLTQLDRFQPARAVGLGHVLGDGENIVVGIDSPAGELTFLFYVDHNEGTAVKDAYLLDVPFTEVTGRLGELARDEVGTTTIDLSLADARARIEQAIETGRMMYPPFETDTWPSARPLAEWMLRRMPPGGVGYPDAADAVDELDTTALVDQLANTSSSLDFDRRDGSDDRDIAETLLELTANYFGGDPLRWSPVTVEILLTDLFPRKVHADRRYLSRIPEIMRTVVTFAHKTREVPARLTADTLDSVDRFEPEYRRLTGAPRDARADLTRQFSPDDPDAYYKALLAAACGSVEAIESLDLSPLPAESVRLDAVEPDIRERVAAIARTAGDAGAELFDPELRTVAHRIVTRIAASDPNIFRRNSKPEMTAAAALWISGTVNDQFRRVTVKAMMAHLGLTGSPAQRAEPMLRALGVERVSGWAYDATLGDPGLLISERRRSLAEHWAWVNGETEHPDHD